mmetsp:Transcript_26976/g.79701  ORF Transcript_26976/g.79701 Transcript_26976/m.79701 type:complete len:328 (-) Transcript_26976:2969-3952(-)
MEARREQGIALEHVDAPPRGVAEGAVPHQLPRGATRRLDERLNVRIRLVLVPLERLGELGHVGPQRGGRLGAVADDGAEGQRRSLPLHEDRRRDGPVQSGQEDGTEEEAQPRPDEGGDLLGSIRIVPQHFVQGRGTVPEQPPQGAVKGLDEGEGEGLPQHGPHRLGQGRRAYGVAHRRRELEERLHEAQGAYGVLQSAACPRRFSRCGLSGWLLLVVIVRHFLVLSFARVGGDDGTGASSPFVSRVVVVNAGHALHEQPPNDVAHRLDDSRPQQYGVELQDLQAQVGLHPRPEYGFEAREHPPQGLSHRLKAARHHDDQPQLQSVLE